MAAGGSSIAVSFDGRHTMQPHSFLPCIIGSWTLAWKSWRFGTRTVAVAPKGADANAKLRQIIRAQENS